VDENSLEGCEEEKSFDVGSIVCPCQSWSLGFSTVVVAIGRDMV